MADLYIFLVDRYMSPEARNQAEKGLKEHKIKL